jgi:hypothetical protein
MKIKDLWGFFKNVPKRGHPYSVTELKLLLWRTAIRNPKNTDPDPEHCSFR